MNRKAEFTFSNALLPIILALFIIAAAVLIVIKSTSYGEYGSKKSSCNINFKQWCLEKYVLSQDPPSWTGEGDQSCVSTSDTTELKEKCKQIIPTIK